MGDRLDRWSVPGAVLLATVLIVGAYILAKYGASPAVAEASTQTALLQAVATRDSNGDGLPDWEKALYGIPLDATTTDYFNLGMTDGEAVAKGLIVPIAIADVPAATSTPDPTSDPDAPAAAPAGTLTAEFTQDFLQLYLTASQANDGADLTDDQMNQLAQQALAQLSATVAPQPDFKAASNLTVVPDSSSALMTYAQAAGAIFAENNPNLPESELQYFGDYVEAGAASESDGNSGDDGNPADLTNISTIAADYRAIAAGLAVLPVPQSLAAGDLELINSAARIAETSSDFTRVDTDPVASILALQQYSPAATELGTAFQTIDQTYTSAGVSLPPGTPGAAFIGLYASVAATENSQSAAILDAASP